jgi:spore protease
MKNKRFIGSEVISDIVKLKKTESSEDGFSSIFKHKGGIVEESYTISTDSQSKYYGKEKGIYKLLTIPNVLFLEDYSHITKIVTNMFKSLFNKFATTDRILVVGLGNRHISSDSLGTKVVSNIKINITNNKKPKVMAFCPSVLGLTGIKTYDTIKGVCDRIKPTHLILIDSLCSSSVDRLGKSIQISNTGICPGSGIGNKQKCIDSSFAKNVYSIGIPLLIYASTFIQNAFDMENISLSTINSTMRKLKNKANEGNNLRILNAIKRVYLNNLDDVIVSIKDIDECTSILSGIVSSAINNCIY